MQTQSITLEGKAYVVLPREEYERLSGLAKAAELPPLPEPNERGNYPAVEYSRVTLARNLIRDRVQAGLNQRQLAELAGVRVETICRLEAGKHVPTIATVDKIDRAIKQYAKTKAKRRGAK